MRPVARAPSLISAVFLVVSAPLVMKQPVGRRQKGQNVERTAFLASPLLFSSSSLNVSVCERLLGYLVAFLADAAVANISQVRSHNSQLGSLEIWKYVFGAGSVSSTKNKTCVRPSVSDCVALLWLLVFVKVSKAILQTHWKTISVFIRHPWRGTVSTIQFELYLDHEDSMIEDANKCKQ